MALEVVYALTFFKPLLEVLRIARGEKQKPYQSLSPLSENNFGKGIEVFTESGPAALAQLFVLQSMADPDVFQYVSIVISVVTTALTIASIDYGMSTDPALRSTLDPSIVGIVPDMGNARVYIFVAMAVCSFAQMAAAVLGTVSLAHIHVWLAAGAWGGKLVIVYVVKLAQRDIYYFPRLPTALAITVALVARFGTMLVSDLGLFALARHPHNLGCGLWWFGKLWPWLLLSVAIGLRTTAPAEFSSAVLHSAAAAAAPLTSGANMTATSQSATSLPRMLNATLSDGEQSPLADPVVLSVIAAVLFALWLLSFAAFFCLANPDCRPSFWRFETAAEYQKRAKWNGEADESKRATLLVKLHPSLLRLIAAEACLWIEANWDTWTNAPPEWFTDDWKRRLPDLVLSQQSLEALSGKPRCRSTLAEDSEQELTLKAAADGAAAPPQ